MRRELKFQTLFQWLLQTVVRWRIFYVGREQRPTNIRFTSYTIWFEKRRIKSAVHEYGRPASFRPIHTELFMGGLRSVMLVIYRASVCAVSQDAVAIRRTLILSVAKLACFRAALKHKIYINIPIYRVSQEDYARLRESVSYVELYRCNPKHIYTKLKG